jgi:hypothetical protein
VAEGAAVRLEQKIERWGRWIDEFEEHPLDEFEFNAMLEVRDEAEELLEVLGDNDAASELDAVDARFERLTLVAPDRVTRFLGQGWWWSRIPSDPEALAYFRGEY